MPEHVDAHTGTFLLQLGDRERSNRSLDGRYHRLALLASTSRGLHYGDMVWSPGRNCAEGHADWVANGRDEVVIKSSAC